MICLIFYKMMRIFVGFRFHFIFGNLSELQLYYHEYYNYHEHRGHTKNPFGMELVAIFRAHFLASSNKLLNPSVHFHYNKLSNYWDILVFLFCEMEEKNALSGFGNNNESIFHSFSFFFLIPLICNREEEEKYTWQNKLNVNISICF